MENRTNNNGGQFITIVLGIAVILYLVSGFIAPYTNTSYADTPNTEPIVYEADSWYNRVTEDEAIFTSRIASCKSGKIFTIRKIVNDKGIGDYQILTKMKSGDYKLLNIDEDKLNIYVMGDNSVKPYVDIEFTNTTSKIVSSADIYLPANYDIETISVMDSVNSNYQIDKGTVVEE